MWHDALQRHVSSGLHVPAWRLREQLPGRHESVRHKLLFEWIDLLWHKLLSVR